MTVAVVNLRIEKGTDFSQSFEIFNDDSSIVDDFTDYSGVCKIRKYPSSPIYHSFEVYVIGAIGLVVISMPKEVTRQLSLGRNYYDLILTKASTNISTKFVEGSIVVSDSASV